MHDQISHKSIFRRILAWLIWLDSRPNAHKTDDLASDFGHEDSAIPLPAASQHPVDVGFHDGGSFGLAGIKLPLVVLQFDEAVAQGRIVARVIEFSDDDHGRES